MQRSFKAVKRDKALFRQTITDGKCFPAADYCTADDAGKDTILLTLGKRCGSIGVSLKCL